MDHPFVSRRVELQRARRALELAADVRVLTALQEHDALRARRESEIETKGRAPWCCVTRPDPTPVRGSGRGRPHGLAEVYGGVDGLLRDGTPMTAARRWTTPAARRVETDPPREADGGPSPHPDYLDSDTESTEEEETEETEEEDEKKK